MRSHPLATRRDFLLGVAGSALALEAGLGDLWGDEEKKPPPLTHVLVNEGHLRRRHPKDAESLLDAAQKFANVFGGDVIEVGADGSAPAIKRRLRQVARPPKRLLILGEEAGIPRFKARIPRVQLETDCFYGDFDRDGLAEVAVSRILGSPKAMLRQLSPQKPPKDPHALLFCSDNPRQQLELNHFCTILGALGASLEVHDWGDPNMLAHADVIALFGHGDPNGWYGGVNWTICTVPTVPDLPRNPVVFAGACSTATPGAPILRKFLEKGCRSYIGASSAAFGFTPAYLANELNLHLFDALATHPDWTVPEIVGAARMHFIKNNKLADALLRLEKGEPANIRETLFSTALQWNVFGSMTAKFPHAARRRLYRRHPLVSVSSDMQPGQAIDIPFEIGQNDGVPVLLFRADWDKDVSAGLELEILQNRERVHLLNWRQQREFWAYIDTISGGYWENGRYHAFALVPLFHQPGPNVAQVRLAGTSKPIRIHHESALQVWPRRTPRRLAPPQVRRRNGINVLWLCRNDDLAPMRKALVATERLQFDHHENFGDKLAPYEFPDDPEHTFDLGCYDVIFIDDVANGYRSFPRGMGERIRDFVHEGGGLIMAGGYESFSGEPAYDGITHGGYAATPIAEALPVEIEAKDDRVKKKVKVGPIDAHHPIASGLDWSTIPPVLGYNRVSAKPEAQILSRLEGDDPFLVVWQFGKGRAVAVTTRSARDWGSEFKNWVYYPRFWGNVINWVTGGPRRQTEHANA